MLAHFSRLACWLGSVPLLYGLCAFAHASQVKAEAPPKVFLRALLSHNDKVLAQFGPGYFVAGKLDPTAENFLYSQQKAKSSVTQIAAHGRLKIILIPQKQSGITTVIYVPSQYEAGTRTVKFLRSQWMKKYFACVFDTSKAQWTLHYNFCFSETDGPYPYNY